MKKVISFLLATTMMLAAATGCSSGNSGAASGAASQSEGNSSQSIDFPTKNITVVVPWAAGGAVDLLMRQIATAASKESGVSFVVNNVTGAGGTVAATQYLSEKDDGYTVLLASAPLVFYQPYVRKVSYNSDSFTPIIGLQKSDLFLVVPADKNISDMKEFAAAAGNGSFTWGSSGPGTIDYVAQTALAKALGITVKNVTYENSAEQITAIVGHNLDCTCAGKGTFEEYVKSGQLKVLGTFADQDVELDGIGKVPSLKSLGYDVSCSNFYFLLGQSSTDPAVIDKLYQIFDTAIKSDDVQKYVSSMKFDMNPLNPNDMKSYFTTAAEQAKGLFG